MTRTDLVSQANHLRQELLDILRAMPYADYLRTEHWLAIRDAARQRAGRKCQVCGAEGLLHVHHNTYIRLGCERAEDTVCLCPGCHELFEENGHLPIPTMWGRM